MGYESKGYLSKMEELREEAEVSKTFQLRTSNLAT